MVKLHRDLKHRVLYKVEDITTCLVEYVKFWDDWEVDRYGNANLEMENAKSGETTLRSCFKATKIHNIDGKILGRDGKPMQAYHQGDNDIQAMKSVEQPQKPSFATVVNGTNEVSVTPKVNFRPMVNHDTVVNSDFVLPIAAVNAAKHKFENTLVGFLLCTSFKGIEHVLEQGPWLIRNILLILTKWTPNMSLAKDKVTRVLVWVKLHNVPVVTYSADGLSLIATQIGTPIMLDAFTSVMCVEAWGRIGFARALIGVSTDKDLKQEVIMAIPNVEDDGITLTMVKIKVEYEWKPPLCIDCHVFGHLSKQCPKHIPEKATPVAEVPDDGFTTVTKRKSKGRSGVYNQKGAATYFKINPPKKNFIYQLVQKTFVDTKLIAQKVGESSNGVKLKNLFEKLNEITTIVPESDEMGKDIMVGESAVNNKHNDNSNSEAEECGCLECRGLNRAPKQSEVRQVVNENQLSICAILESHVDLTFLSNVCSKVFSCWDRISNAGLCNRGCRIIVGWNVDVVHVMVLAQSSQALHETSNLKEGSSAINRAMYEFKDCVADIEVMDVNCSGLHYTWNRKPKGGGGILKKLERIMANLDFIDTFLGSYSIFQPYRISDHAPAALDSDLANVTLREEECACVQAFTEAKLNEEHELSYSCNGARLTCMPHVVGLPVNKLRIELDTVVNRLLDSVSANR
ncbi:trichome birefringence-like protein 3 [Tanacetum coccineum]|uniref:Trichome birefringence-like protein 3 n=1 Tax=Tanacetum coccineum TaxID=301880 RepID=A0ABQ5EL72_9ASTR